MPDTIGPKSKIPVPPRFAGQEVEKAKITIRASSNPNVRQSAMITLQDRNGNEVKTLCKLDSVFGTQQNVDWSDQETEDYWLYNSGPGTVDVDWK